MAFWRNFTRLSNLPSDFARKTLNLASPCSHPRSFCLFTPRWFRKIWFLIFTWSASANVFGGPASGLLLDALLFAFSLIARLEERYFYVFSFRLALLELLCGLITAIISRDIFSIYVPCAQILLVFCVCFDFLCLSAAKANAKLLEELSAKKELSEPEKLAKEALERLANSPDKEEALLQANFIRIKLKQIRRMA